MPPRWSPVPFGGGPRHSARADRRRQGRLQLERRADRRAVHGHPGHEPVPDRGARAARTEYWVAGVVGALLFFASLLAHEMGHALVARHEGLCGQRHQPVAVRRSDQVRVEPRDGGRRAADRRVGPLTTLACAGLFFVLSRVLDGAGSVGLAGTMFGWLAFINLLLAGLNMIPAVPLDGGHVLSALIWMEGGNRQRASLAAARVGQVLGVGLLGLGSCSCARTATTRSCCCSSGSSSSAAPAGEIRSAPVRAAIEGVITRDVMAANPPTSLRVDDRGRVPPDAARGHDASRVSRPGARRTDHRPAHRGLDPGGARAEQWASLRVNELAFPIDRVAVALADEPVLGALQRNRPARRSTCSSSAPTAGWSAWSTPTRCRTRSAPGSKPAPTAEPPANHRMCCVGGPVSDHLHTKFVVGRPLPGQASGTAEPVGSSAMTDVATGPGAPRLPRSPRATA